MISISVPRVLTIAGSDSGGGAGIQGDIKAISALGCYALSVITSLTAQNTTSVTAVHNLPPSFVTAQLKAVFEDIGADAIKIGMLSEPELIEAVEQFFKHNQAKNIVLDPVMVAKSGARLLSKQAETLLVEKIFPLATLVTPNLEEVEVLTGLHIDSVEEMEHAAKIFIQMGAKAVLIKGGHLPGNDTSDCLVYIKNEILQLDWFPSSRIPSKNTHGTGCTYSSAIACFLAQGYELAEAVRLAKQYLHQAIAASVNFQIGKGHGPLHHFFQMSNR